MRKTRLSVSKTSLSHSDSDRRIVSTSCAECRLIRSIPFPFLIRRPSSSWAASKEKLSMPRELVQVVQRVCVTRDRALGEQGHSPLGTGARLAILTGQVFVINRDMSRTCTISSWIVKPSRNREFVVAWRAYAKWLVSRPGLTSPPRLFRDSVDPAHYVGVDCWQDKDAFTEIQSGVDYGRQSYKLQQLTIHFSSWTLSDETEEES